MLKAVGDPGVVVCSVLDVLGVGLLGLMLNVSFGLLEVAGCGVAIASLFLVIRSGLGSVNARVGKYAKERSRYTDPLGSLRPAEAIVKMADRSRQKRGRGATRGEENSVRRLYLLYVSEKSVARDDLPPSWRAAVEEGRGTM